MGNCQLKQILTAIDDLTPFDDAIHFPSTAAGAEYNAAFICQPVAVI